jgi:hypothetical protein
MAPGHRIEYQDQRPDGRRNSGLPLRYSIYREVSVQALFAAMMGGTPTIYLGWGGFTIQLGNFIVIVTMLVLFVLALVLPFPAGRKRK